jgi:hypothetical protein
LERVAGIGDRELHYEYTYTHDNLIAGLYLAALSVFGMVIFHEFLAQFEDGAAYVRRNKRPPWGLRWFTSPYSTACGAIAWENFPAPDGTPATVLNGLASLERARQIKRNATENAVVERHARNLADARRTAELTAARKRPELRPGSGASARQDGEDIGAAGEPRADRARSFGRFGGRAEGGADHTGDGGAVGAHVGPDVR